MKASDITPAFLISRMTIECLSKIIEKDWGIEKVANQIAKQMKASNNNVFEYYLASTPIAQRPKPNIIYIVDTKEWQITDVQWG